MSDIEKFKNDNEGAIAVADAISRGEIGHNGPPGPIDLVTEEYSDILSEAQNWTDGEPVSDEAGMLAVDGIIKQFKTYRTALNKAGKERTDPLHKAWKAEVAAVKVYTDDADLIQKALIATVAPFKAALAEKKAAEGREKWEAANKARLEMERLARETNAADLDVQREIEAWRTAAINAEKAAKSVDAVKGMRKVTKHEVLDMRALVNFIAKNHKEEMAEFATEFARKNHASIPDDVVRTWTEKEAF